MTGGTLVNTTLVLGLLLCGSMTQGVKAQLLTTREHAIEVTATVQQTPPRITLDWSRSSDNRRFVISRKSSDAGAWTQLAIVSAGKTTFTDPNVASGEGYEYAITKEGPGRALSGYIHAGIHLPPVDSRGKILLLVENTHAGELRDELIRLARDLTGDGWTVLRRDVNRNQSVHEIKALIRTEYDADPANLRCLVLFGRVPVPYSGNYNADDHEDHTGAWPADVFYGDMNGHWTDSTVNNRSAARIENRNVPGDGKFDQSVLPSDVELAVGRVDLSNLPQFLPATEAGLLRRYLNKNHAYRHGQMNLQRRGVLFDGFGESGGEAYAASGWRNFAPFFGANTREIGWGDFFPTSRSADYLWAYIAGGGGSDHMTCYGVGETRNFVNAEVRSAFMMVFGSYFGDWDSANNFLRAPLAASHPLATLWAGRPHWFLHHMAMGETIGYSTRLSQNNAGLYQPAQFTRQVHVALMGDPTLRMHVVAPPSSVTAATSPGAVTLAWNHSPESDIAGYHVYRSPWEGGPYTRLTQQPVSISSYSDPSGEGTFTYMVRAIKLESSPSGTYFNSSQGIFVSVAVPPSLPPIATTPIEITQARIEGGNITLHCVGEPRQSFVIELSADLRQWTAVSTNTFDGSSLQFTRPVQSAPSFFRTRLRP